MNKTVIQLDDNLFIDSSLFSLEVFDILDYDALYEIVATFPDCCVLVRPGAKVGVVEYVCFESFYVKKMSRILNIDQGDVLSRLEDIVNDLGKGYYPIDNTFNQN